MNTSLHQSSGIVLDKTTERMEESRDGENTCEMMSPGPAMAVTLTDSQQLWLPVQNLHENKLGRIPAQMVEMISKPHPLLATDTF